MTDSVGSRLGRVLSAGGASALRGVAVEIGPDRQVDIPSALEAWRRHVEKMEADLSLPDEDRAVWGGRTTCLRPLSIRNFVQRGLDVLDDDLAAKVNPLLQELDEKFVSFTEEDTMALIGKVDDLPSDSEHWWWRRIPVHGPIRRLVFWFATMRPSVRLMRSAAGGDGIRLWMRRSPWRWAKTTWPRSGGHPGWPSPSSSGTDWMQMPLT